MNYSVLIVAGGKGQRMGLGYNKVFYPLKDGMTVLDMTVKLFRMMQDVNNLLSLRIHMIYIRLHKHMKWDVL